MKANRTAISAALLTLGMMSAATSGVAIAAAPSVSADIPPASQEQQAEGYDGKRDKNVYYGTQSNTTNTHSGGADATVMMQQDNTINPSTGNEVVSSTDVIVEEKGPIQTTYPSFSDEEIDKLFNVIQPVEEAPGVPPSEETAPVDPTSDVYRHVPVNPVYTYGKDEEGQGVCAGTEEFCAKSEELWKNFEDKVANDEPITHTEGENKGQLILPESYKESVTNMPNVKEDCPPGYESYPAGNPDVGVSDPHCGKLEGNVYTVKR